jgi:acyl-coenzyme A synthetase/AMP-(fatty) acid ligase
VNEMVAHPDTAEQDFSSLRLATSAGAPLPAELYDRWKQAFNVELLDGLGTEEMWHIFISNRPGAVKPGTLGTVVPGFDVRVRDNLAHDLADGEVGMLWVRGFARDRVLATDGPDQGGVSWRVVRVGRSRAPRCRRLLHLLRSCR